MSTLTLQFFELSGKNLEELDRLASKKKQSLTGKPLLCRVCKHIITTDAERIFVQSSHVHTCTNPGGHVFDFGCFSQAPGCSTVGGASSEYTWFSDYQWQIAVCNNCQGHMGWLFRDGDNFYGLITSGLISSN